jgi:plastocyanin
MHLLRSWIGMAAAAAAIGACAIPALATGDGALPSSAAFSATDFSWHVSGGSATHVQIAVGGTVAFDYPVGSSAHNADFGAGPHPSTCTQLGGASSGAVPPLPHAPTAPGWSGSCTFATAGTYAFHCDLHPSMNGTIVVGEAAAPPPPPPPPGPGTGGGGGGATTPSGAPPPPTGGPTPTPTPPAGGTPTPPATGGGGAGAPAPLPGNAGRGSAALLGRVQLARAQRGTRVRGTVALGAARVRLVVELRGRLGARTVVLGRLTRPSAGPGRVAVSVALNTAGRRALRHARRLALTVRIVATPRSGRALTRSVAITLRP